MSEEKPYRHVDEIAALRTQVAELTEERDQAREGAETWRKAANADASRVDVLKGIVATLRAQVAALRKAAHRAAPWIADGSWHDAIIADIKAALDMSGGMK